MLKIRTICATLVGVSVTLLLEANVHARSVYLNGDDISSARGQTLKKVNLKIDENGDVFIEAPQYKVDQEKTYTPLSSYKQTRNAPPHGVPGPLASSPLAKPGEAPQIIESPASEAPVENGAAKLQDKPGSKTGG